MKTLKKKKKDLLADGIIDAAEVKELERGELETDLHREVQEILLRHGISMK